LCSSVCSVFSCGFVHLADEELALSKWSQEIRTADDASEALFFSRLYVILICYLLPIFPWDGWDVPMMYSYAYSLSPSIGDENSNSYTSTEARKVE
jgi:hypothetical protein